MNYSHPSELEIQEYALDKSECATAVTEHIESCTICSTEVKTYQLMFSEIKQQPAPAFDFNLSGLVIPQIKKSSSKFSVDNFIAGFLVLFASFCIGIPVFLFRKNILYMFTGVPSFFIYAIIGSTSIILIIKILLMYKKYQNQMRFLNIN
jgi:hypothetical protein